MFQIPLKKVLLAIGLVTVLAGCVQVYEDEKKEPGAAGTTTPATGEPVILGVLLPLSGSGAAYGKPIQQVLEIAVKQINESGGMNGRPLKLEFDDGVCKEEPAKIAIENLVSLKKVKYIIGGVCSSETLTAAPVVEKGKVVLLSPASSNQAITKAGDFVFRNYPSDEIQGKVLAEIATSKGYKKVGGLVEEQPFTEGIADAFSAAYKASGGELVVEKYPTEGSQDFRAQITKLQAAKVDTFFLDVQTPEKVDLLLKQLQEAGVKGPFFMNDVAIGAPKEVQEKYKDYIDGSFGTEPGYDKSHPELIKLQEAYKAKTNEDLPYLYVMAPAYDAVHILKEALATAGEDPVKVKDYLYTVKGRKGLAGELTFDANGDSNYKYEPRVLKGGVLQPL